MSRVPGPPSSSVVTPADENNFPLTNYKRWMTDMSSTIEGLRIHELAIPGAHNSGVDMAGTWGPFELLAACQNKSFPEQLAAGARHLDLRLQDSSYKKFAGRHSPTMTFIEIFEFNHGFVTAGRRLEHLVRDVKNFVTENPGEIVLLDFHKYDKGKFSDSLDRCLPYFTPIKNLLIPYSARDMTIGDIRQAHPGRNIILLFEYGAPLSWNSNWVQQSHLWPSLGHVWSSDFSEDAITTLATDSMINPPNTLYWALSAACRNANGAQYLPSNHKIRTEVFVTGRENANIVMVDFIERVETVAGVTDRCIALNKKRGLAASKPPAPKNLVIKQAEGANAQNTLQFEWARSDTEISIRHDEVFEGDNLLFATSERIHSLKNLPLKNYTFKVRSVSTSGKFSDFSPPYILIQDKTPPTVPENLRFTQVGLKQAIFEWDPSFDEAGIEHYEVSHDQQQPTLTSQASYTANTSTANKEHTFKVRAKDINGLYSEYAELTLKPRPDNPGEPRFEIKQLAPNASLYSVKLTWNPVENIPYNLYQLVTVGVNTQRQLCKPETPSTFPLGVAVGRYTIKTQFEFSTSELGPRSEYQFTFDPTPPQPVSGLKTQSRTATSTIIEWLGSPSTTVERYAISLNEEPPVMLPTSANSHELKGLPLDEEFLVEVWAINNFTIPSTTQFIIIEPETGYPSTPKNFRFTQPFLPTLQWDAPHQPISSYSVVLTGPGGNELLYHVAEPELSTFLLPRTRYDVRITAWGSGGASPPLLAEFGTL